MTAPRLTPVEAVPANVPDDGLLRGSNLSLVEMADGFMMNPERASPDPAVECVVESMAEIPSRYVPRNYIYSLHELDTETGRISEEPVSSFRAPDADAFGADVLTMGLRAVQMEDGTHHIWNLAPTNLTRDENGNVSVPIESDGNVRLSSECTLTTSYHPISSHVAANPASQSR